MNPSVFASIATTVLALAFTAIASANEPFPNPHSQLAARRPAAATVSVPAGASPASLGLTEPILTIRRDTNALELSWPLTGATWDLEETAEFNPAPSWRRTGGGVHRTNSLEGFLTVRLPVPAANRFYRLRQLAPPIPDLTGAWNLDEGADTVAPDASGTGNLAWLHKVEWTAGRIGPGSVGFNGASGMDGSWLVISNSSYRVLPPAGRPFTISFWFRPDHLEPGWRGLAGNETEAGDGWRLTLHSLGPGTNELAFASDGPGASLSVSGRPLLLPGQWYHLTATYDGAAGSLYLDRQLLARGAGALAASEAPIYLGGHIGGYDSFAGSIDAVRTYTNALTSEAIALTGYWPLDEGDGVFAADASVHGHHATVTGPTVWTAGRQGGGIQLSNSALVIPNPDATVLPPTGKSFSVSLWLQPLEMAEGWHGLLSCADGTNGGWRLALRSRTTEPPDLHCWSIDCGGTLDLHTTLPLTSGVWSKLDLTYNGGLMTVYLDGRKIHADSGGIQGSAAPIRLGAVEGLPPLHARIDELKIYGRERPATEIGPVAETMWETVFINATTNILLQGTGPSGKPLSYSILPDPAPTNGALTHSAGSARVTYAAGPRKGPDVFAYTVSDGEFTSPPTLVMLSVVQPHWLAPGGGAELPRDGASPERAWSAGNADALDAIWQTNNYYDAFIYAPGEYETRGWKYRERTTAHPGCKHLGAGSTGPAPTILRLVDTWDAWGEGVIFGAAEYPANADGFEAHHLVLDCNADHNPKYTVGQPVSLVIPLTATARVASVTLRWDDSTIAGNNLGWRLGRAQEFSLYTRAWGTNGYRTNGLATTSTGRVETIAVNADTDEIILTLERRAPGVAFYGLAECEVTGGTVSRPTAHTTTGEASRLDPDNPAYSILNAVDGNTGTAWASGPEVQVEIVLPLAAVTEVTGLNLHWNCRTIANLGRLGPAADFQVSARNPATGESAPLAVVRQPIATNGRQTASFGTLEEPQSIVTDELVLRLTARDADVVAYSLRELSVQNGATRVPLKLPTAENHLARHGIVYSVLRAFDGAPTTQWASGTQGMLSAVDVTGSNLKFTHLRIIGFGTKAARECFPLAIHSPSPARRPLQAAGNVRVEDCVFAAPATNNTDGVTVVLMANHPPHTLTNAVVRRCTVEPMAPYFPVSQAFTALHVEDCQVTDCGTAVYFEPDPAATDDIGPVLIRRNRFFHVRKGIYLFSHTRGQFDALTCLDNEIVLTGSSGWGFAICDTCSAGPAGSATNVTVLNNIIRYADWGARPAFRDGGLWYSDIQHAVFGNNLVALGTSSALRVRQCPAGRIPPPGVVEYCDGTQIWPPPGPEYSPCLDALPPGYRRAWFNNRDLQGGLLEVRHMKNGADGPAAQQQWP